MGMRNLFYPPFGEWLHGDLSQIEMRGGGAETGDPVLIKEFRDGVDRHENTRLLVDQLVGWSKIGLINPALKNVVAQRTTSKVVNFNVLFTDDPHTIEHSLNKAGIFGVGKAILDPLYMEIHRTYNNVSFFKFLYVPYVILKNKYIINYVRRRRRFNDLTFLTDTRALEGAAFLKELIPDYLTSNLLLHPARPIAPPADLVLPQFDKDYTLKDISKRFSKDARKSFMEAWNFLIQGPYSGDIPKLAVSCVARKWAKEGIVAVPLFTLYDSVECACEPAHRERAVREATPYFLAPPVHLLTDEEPPWHRVPFNIEWSVGPNWGEQTKLNGWNATDDDLDAAEPELDEFDMSEALEEG